MNKLNNEREKLGMPRIEDQGKVGYYFTQEELLNLLYQFQFALKIDNGREFIQIWLDNKLKNK